MKINQGGKGSKTLLRSDVFFHCRANVKRLAIVKKEPPSLRAAIEKTLKTKKTLVHFDVC